MKDGLEGVVCNEECLAGCIVVRNGPSLGICVIGRYEPSTTHHL